VLGTCKVCGERCVGLIGIGATPPLFDEFHVEEQIVGFSIHIGEETSVSIAGLNISNERHAGAWWK
jgi:hypothetical protein